MTCQKLNHQGNPVLGFVQCQQNCQIICFQCIRQSNIDMGTVTTMIKFKKTILQKLQKNYSINRRSQFQKTLHQIYLQIIQTFKSSQLRINESWNLLIAHMENTFTKIQDSFNEINIPQEINQQLIYDLKSKCLIIDKNNFNKVSIKQLKKFTQIMKSNIINDANQFTEKILYKLKNIDENLQHNTSFLKYAQQAKIICKRQLGQVNSQSEQRRQFINNYGNSTIFQSDSDLDVDNQQLILGQTNLNRINIVNTTLIQPEYIDRTNFSQIRKHSSIIINKFFIAKKIINDNIGSIVLGSSQVKQIYPHLRFTIRQQSIKKSYIAFGVAHFENQNFQIGRYMAAKQLDDGIYCISQGVDLNSAIVYCGYNQSSNGTNLGWNFHQNDLIQIYIDFNKQKIHYRKIGINSQILKSFQTSIKLRNKIYYPFVRLRNQDEVEFVSMY